MRRRPLDGIAIFRTGLTLVWSVAVAAILALVLLNNLAPALGHQPLAVRGRSMEPAIPLGSLIVTGAVAPADIVPGDVVSVRLDRVIVTHRVIGVTEIGGERLLQLQGDGNASPDSAPVPAAAVIGVVRGVIPFGGYLVALLSSPLGLTSVLSMLGSLLTATWLLDELGGGSAGGSVRERLDALRDERRRRVLLATSRG